MPNLYSETDEMLSRFGYSWDDVDWVGGKKYRVPIANFIEVAKETEYDSGYGSPEVATDLVIVLNNGTWFSRAEYDGSEWWRYNCLPSMPRDVSNVSRLAWDDFTTYSPTLDEINSDIVDCYE